MAAALSFYTVFSLPPLIALTMLVVGWVIPPDQFRDILSTQLGELVGAEGARQIVSLVEGASRPEVRGVAATISVLTLAFAATGAFVQLQEALNAAWEVAPDPERGGVRAFLLKRLLSLAMIAAVGFLLLASLLLSTLLAAAGGFLHSIAPQWLSHWFVTAADFSLSLSVVAFMFAAIFQYVPDASVEWRDALVGGLFTGVLFTGGKIGIGYYFGRSDPGSVYGAAGSFALALLWIYYSAMILLLGAEFTEVLARTRGAPLRPQRGAVRVRRTLKRIADGDTREKPPAGTVE
jgi:membrane protein